MWTTASSSLDLGSNLGDVNDPGLPIKQLTISGPKKGTCFKYGGKWQATKYIAPQTLHQAMDFPRSWFIAFLCLRGSFQLCILQIQGIRPEASGL